MTQAEFLGMFVLATVTLIGLFISIYRPINENTKVMTTLTIRIEQLTDNLREQELDLHKYKEHMKESQKRQWVKLDEHSNSIMKHNMELEQIKQMADKEETK